MRHIFIRASLRVRGKRMISGQKMQLSAAKLAEPRLTPYYPHKTTKTVRLIKIFRRKMKDE